MQDAQQWVVDALKARSLPSDILPFLNLIKNDENASFEIQENTYWDYKDRFPHSMTDDYFWGICRLICGFHNRYGGLIIFGVHDQARTPGFNKVHVDIERLNTRLREVLNVPVECVHRRYRFGSGKPIASNRYEDDAFDILLIPKRDFSTPVVRFREDFGKYRSSDIFVRQNHEIIRARSLDITELYTPRSDYGLQQEVSDASIPSALPQRPSVIREFVGRIPVLDQLFSWFVTKEDIRTFLHGRGGSGKSTIAFEFASIISKHGADIKIRAGDKIDRVIFLSAKERGLDTKTRKIHEVSTDFTTADELMRSILLLSDWSTAEKIDALSADEARDELRQLLDLQSLLIIIDDIDTLYTKKIDDGGEFLISTLARAKLRSKIVYTVRQMPSLAMSAAIEVPGLIGEEYESFIAACCNQFQVAMPDAGLMQGRLRAISEGIPLIIETIVALRRLSASYENAISGFQSVGGSDVRKYLFSREYGALSSNQAKYVLAALALFKKPVSFEELQYALQYDKSAIQDSIGSISEMFVNRVPQEDDTTLFTVGEVTREFVLEESSKLDRFQFLKSRIDNYQKPFSAKKRSLILLTEQVEGFLSRNEYARAVTAIDQVIDAEILEHRDFKLLAVRIYSDEKVNRLENARRLFNDLFQMRYRNSKIYRDWLAMERRTETSYHNICTICDRVLAVDWISTEDKLYFHYFKAGTQYNHARQLLSINSDEAFPCLVDAMDHHLIVFDQKEHLDRRYFERTVEFSTNTMHNLIQASLRFDLESELFQYIEVLCGKKQGALDPIGIPLTDYVRSIPERALKSDLSRKISSLSRLEAAIRKGTHLFRNAKLATNLLSAIAEKKKIILTVIKSHG